MTKVAKSEMSELFVAQTPGNTTDKRWRIIGLSVNLAPRTNFLTSWNVDSGTDTNHRLVEVEDFRLISSL
jgi:hypothetical protein